MLDDQFECRAAKQFVDNLARRGEPKFAIRIDLIEQRTVNHELPDGDFDFPDQ